MEHEINGFPKRNKIDLCKHKSVTRIFNPFSAKEKAIKAVKWLKDGQAVTNQDLKYTLFDQLTLRVNNVQTEDGGVYQCFVTLDGGKQIQSSGELRLGGKISY